MKLVFVLGAGSSMPYGLPSSTELNDTIENILNLYINGIAHDEITGPLEYIFEELFPKNKNLEKIERFASLYTHDYFHTIDEFLNGRLKDKEIVRIAKTLIALVLLYYEKTDPLTSRANKNGWYGYFWKQIKEYITKGVNDGKIDRAPNISFLTFNYDRSLEKFLDHNIESIFYPSNQLLSIFNIIHMYGSIGTINNWPHKKKDHVPYGIDFNNEKLLFSNSVSTASQFVYHPSETVYAHLPETRSLDVTNIIAQADKIYFLGFGFHPQNMEKLKIEDSKAAIFGTTYQMEPYRIRRLERKYPKMHFQPITDVALYNEIISEHVEECFYGK